MLRNLPAHVTRTLFAVIGVVLTAPAGAPRALALAGQEPDSVIQIPPLRVEVLRSPLVGARTPYAVAGLGPDALGGPRPAAFLSDRLVALPGLQLQNRHNLAVGERVAIRGFGARAQFGVRGLRVVVDGIPATLPDGQTTLDHLELSSLGRAELLRGPGSSLYGNGAGGVLLLESLRPEGPTRTTLRGSAGSGGLREGSALLTATGADGSATLAAVSRFEYEGFRADPTGAGHYGQAERWSVNVRHLRPLLGGQLALTVAGVDLDAENPGSLPVDSLGDPDRPAWGGNVRQRAGKTVEQLQVGGSWRGPLGQGLVDVAAWAISRDVRNPIPSDIIGLDRLAGGVRGAVEGDLAGIRWGAGLDLEVMSDERTNHANDGGSEGELGLAQDETVRALGLHLRAARDLGPASLHGALRHDRVRFEAVDRFLDDGADDSGVRTLTAFSPSLGALVPVTGSLDLFASLSSFLETPTTTELANRPQAAGGFNPELEPTRGWTYESGLRGRALGRLGWELTAFRTELRDELVPFEVPAAPGRTFFRNAGRSRHQGFEASVRAALAGGISARAAYTRVDARFRTAAGDAEAGNRLPGRAPHHFAAVLQLDRRVVSAALDVSWTDAVPVDDANTSEAPSHTLVGLRASAPDLAVSGRVSASPFVAVRNVFDEDHVGSVVPNAFLGRFYEPGPGREVRLGLSLTF